MNKNGVSLIVTGVIAGVSYFIGKKNGFNECLYKCQDAVLKVILDDRKDEKTEEK